jgi:glucokinase
LILTGDIGGTKCSFALLPAGRGRREPVAAATVPSADHASLESALADFVAAAPGPITAAAFGVAGPVVGTSARVTNLPWTLHTESLAQMLGTPHVRLVNDLVATALGIAWLRPDEVATLQAGSARAQGNIAVLAAGTGLGEAVLIADRGRQVPVPSEGGHTDFAPRDEVETTFWAWLREEHPRVTYEHVLSGNGLVNLYRFLHRSAPHPPLWDPGKEHTPEAAAMVSAAAMAGACPLCRESLERFVSVFGAQAGNLALTVLATGGVYLAGGIAPKILPVLRDRRFTDAFNAKEPHADLMRSIPVSVVLNQGTPLLGAARLAEEMPGDTA